MPAKMLNLNPGLKEITHSITGGALAAQGKLQNSTLFMEMSVRRDEEIPNPSRSLTANRLLDAVLLRSCSLRNILFPNRTRLNSNIRTLLPIPLRSV